MIKNILRVAWIKDEAKTSAVGVNDFPEAEFYSDNRFIETIKSHLPRIIQIFALLAVKAHVEKVHSQILNILTLKMAG